MRVPCSICLLLLGAGGALAQAAKQPPRFEVASVKLRPATAGERGRVAIALGPAGITMTNVTLKAIVQWAYRLQPIQVSGPGWLEDDRYDVSAKASEAAPDQEIRKMTQTLLAERFKLQFHRDTKVMPAYVLTVGKSGHKLKKSMGEGEMRISPGERPMVFQFSHVTLAQLTEHAGSELEAVVVDETGLEGSWDFTLDVSVFGARPAASQDDAISMMIEAVNTQLGIKIDEKKAPAELLVVDHVERQPVEN
jgi:uncharacterized protein (TIGR03435 family)